MGRHHIPTAQSKKSYAVLSATRAESENNMCDRCKSEKAAIEECKKKIEYLLGCIKDNKARDNNTYADGGYVAYKNILKILEGEE